MTVIGKSAKMREEGKKCVILDKKVLDWVQYYHKKVQDWILKKGCDWEAVDGVGVYCINLDK